MAHLPPMTGPRSRWLLSVWFLACAAGLARSLAVGRVQGPHDPLALALALLGGAALVCYAWKNGAWASLVRRLPRRR